MQVKILASSSYSCCCRRWPGNHGRHAKANYPFARERDLHLWTSPSTKTQVLVATPRHQERLLLIDARVLGDVPEREIEHSGNGLIGIRCVAVIEIRFARKTPATPLRILRLRLAVGEVCRETPLNVKGTDRIGGGSNRPAHEHCGQLQPD